MQKDIPYDQLEAYLRGDLTQAERAAFEDRLNADPELRRELDLYRQIRDANRDEGLSALEAKLQAAQANVKDLPQKGRIRPLWTWIAAAVLLAALLFFGGRRFLFPTAADPAQLYAEYAQSEFSFQEMSDGNDLATIQELLAAGRYADALTPLDAYLSTHPDAPAVLLAKGIALRETDQPAAAITVFSSLGSQYPLYRTESLWQTALAHLKQGQLPESLATLRQIPSDASRYPEARELIRDLEAL